MSQSVFRTGSEQAVQVTTLIPLDVRERLRVEAKKAGKGIHEYLRDMIFSELGLDAEKWRAGQKVCARDTVTATEPVSIRKPTPPQPAWRPESVLDLASRGFTGQQIAARLRMPYRAVMAEMARQIDDAVKCETARKIFEGQEAEA